MKEAIPAYVDGQYRFRQLSVDDLKATLAWRNRDNIRRWFKNSEIVDIDSHRRWFESYSMKSDDYIFIAEFDNAVVGQMAVYNISGDEAEVGRFIVQPEVEGKGVMKKCMRKFITFISEHFQLERIYLEVYKDNKKAIEIYRSIGFEIISQNSGLVSMRLKYAC